MPYNCHFQPWIELESPAGKEIKDIPVIETCFYYIDLNTLRKMALVTGHEADVALIDEKLNAVKSTFDSLYWKGENYMSKSVSTPVICGSRKPA